MRTIYSQRQALVQSIIKDEIEDYFSAQRMGKRKKRGCAYCGKKFYPKMSYHFFHQPECRKLYYQGQFRPRR